MEGWTTITYLQSGAYIAIMLAVLGVPQMLSSYFDLKARRQEEERRREDRRQDEEHRQDERRSEEERRRLEEERRRLEEERRRQDDERRRQDAETAERRHQEFMTLLVAAVNNRGNQGSGQDEFIHTLQQTIEDLRAENAQLRRQNGNGSPSS